MVLTSVYKIIWLNYVIFTKSPCNQAAVEDEWNGFWSMAATMEKKKKRKLLTAIQSKEEKLEQARSNPDLCPDLYL